MSSEEKLHFQNVLPFGEFNREGKATKGAQIFPPYTVSKSTKEMV